MNDHLHALPPGHQLNEYRIERVIGTGGFGITYYARDIHLNKEVAIKEYLPNEFALRADGTTVKPKSSSDQGNYQWGLDRFLEEARTLARFDHPHLNKVFRFFEDNGTAYMVLEYIAGETLSQPLHREGRLDPARLQRLIDELLSGIEEVHQAGFAHRDIKPSNIMLREDGSAVLLDFGAARQAIGQRSKPITSVLTPGYAPIEQYSQKADRVGPWTDLYALGMVLYRCISGVSDGELVDATERMSTQRRGEQDMARAVEAGKGRYDESLLKAVDWAIKVNEEDRPQSVSAFRAALAGGGISGEIVHEAGKADPAAEPSKPVDGETGEARVGSGKRSVLVWILAVVAGLVVTGVVLWPTVNELVYWSDVQCGDGSDVRAYQEKYPAGRYEQEAGECLTAIEAAEARKFQDAVGRTASPRTVDDNGWTDLHYAAALDLPELARELLKSGANVDARLKDDGEALTDELKQILRNAGKDYEQWTRDGESPLYTAARENAHEVAALLIDKGADINAKIDGGWTPLHSAARRNAHEVAALLIDKGADINNADNRFGTSPLHTAARENAHDTTALLIEKGADVHANNNFGYTPLHVAASGNARDTTALLIEKGADVNAKDDSHERTPLHSAAAPRNSHETAALLIEKGADVNAKDYEGDTPLHDAAFNNPPEVAALLIEKGADVNAKNYEGDTPLHATTENNAHETAALLIEKGADINAKDNDGRTPLRRALENYAHEVAALLIEKGAGIHAKDGDGWAPLHTAARHNAHEVVALLIEKGADINAKDKNGETPLHDAAVHNSHEVAALLIGKGANVNAKDNEGRTPLHTAAGNNAHEVAALLIEKGADINAKDNEGRTPLRSAAANNAHEVAALLIGKGANVNAKDNEGRTPLHTAAGNNAHEVAALLIEKGADIHAKRDAGWTPLHIAASSNSRGVAALLIDKGADINAKDDGGSTPLHQAAYNNFPDVAALLIEKGADINAKDNKGRTPLDYAKHSEAHDVIRLLEQ